MLLILFWLFFFLITYHYIIFPALTFIAAAHYNKEVMKEEITPSVSLIIAAYNEEKVIRKKILNSFALDYPSEQLEIIIVSDGSTDCTSEIVKEYESKGVKGLHNLQRRGKTSALNRAVEEATGEIILFSDANSMYEPQVVKTMMRNFNDSSVGGVCGRKKIIKNNNREASRGDNLFWKYESIMKVKQSLTGSITTGDGEIFAIRRKLYSHVPEQIINDDTAITLNILAAGYRVVYEPDAISCEEASIVLQDDFNVKVRMTLGGYQTMAFFRKHFFPPTNYYSIQFLSHKVLRWTMPFLLLGLLVFNAFFLHGFYLIFFMLQMFFYLLALSGYLLGRGKAKNIIFYYPLYYCTMNLAALLGFLSFMRGETGVSVWKKAIR